MVRARTQLGPGAGAYPLVGEADPKARAASLVDRDGSWGLWLQDPGGPGPAHWRVGSGPGSFGG